MTMGTIHLIPHGGASVASNGAIFRFSTPHNVRHLSAMKHIKGAGDVVDMTSGEKRRDAYK